MRNFCVLTVIERIFLPNCSILNLHSNNVNSLKSLFLKKVVANIIVIKTRK